MNKYVNLFPTPLSITMFLGSRNRLIVSANAPILGLDLNGAIVEWNRRLSEMTGNSDVKCWKSLRLFPDPIKCPKAYL